jgi:hypothetical protein
MWTVIRLGALDAAVGTLGVSRDQMPCDRRVVDPSGGV